MPYLFPELAKMRAADEDRLWLEVETWLHLLTRRTIGDSITHVYLFMYETTSSFGIQVTCSEGALSESGPVRAAFADAEDVFHIDRLFVGEAWEHALLLATAYARRYVAEGAARDLVCTRAVEVGFVDGDMHTIWPEPAA